MGSGKRKLDHFSSRRVRVNHDGGCFSDMGGRRHRSMDEAVDIDRGTIIGTKRYHSSLRECRSGRILCGDGRPNLPRCVEY